MMTEWVSNLSPLAVDPRTRLVVSSQMEEQTGRPFSVEHNRWVSRAMECNEGRMTTVVDTAGPTVVVVVVVPSEVEAEE